MRKYSAFRIVQNLGLALTLVFTFACSETEEPMPEEVKDSLYFKFTLDGSQYISEIKESNLVPGSGNEKMDDSSNGMNFMMYAYYSNIIWMNYSDKCGAAPGRDCLSFEIQMPENLKVGTYPSLFTYGIRFNGQYFLPRYNDPALAPKPSDLNVNVVIQKYDEINHIVEGTVEGQFYKDGDPEKKTFTLKGEFRVFIYTG